ncbi:MAG: lytic transglycosylase domain-containing protein [Proteobacteria bacterium]|nr:lytic transglycosylase domain-containing protein [Pseudomonadota bacterium]MCP4921600.1 lytic transglycosylase domain-containing protein [Pseudomonadota bacterium]
MLLLCLSAALALEPPSHPDEGPRIALSDAELAPGVPMSDPLRKALAGRRHSTAANLLLAIDTSTLSGSQVGDVAFLTAWSLLRANRANDAIPLLEVVRSAEHVPQAYLALTVGEILVADDRHAEAAAALEDVDPASVIWPRAQLMRATALREAGATADSRALLEELIARPDPAEGSEVALETLAALAGLKTEASYPYDRRLWAAYPRSSAGRRAASRLSSYGGYATWEESALRSDRLMASYKYDAAVSLMARLDAAEPSPEACMGWYAHGRSLFKLNRLTESIRVLGPAGQKCAGLDDDRGAKSLYLAGKAEERKKAYAAAAVHYAAIAELYPEHTMADDGLALAGIALQEAGDPEGARTLWSRQVEAYPHGDLAGEGYWRLAWGSWLAGDTAGAIEWATEAQARVPLETDPEHVRAAIYWSARWTAWPDLEDPAVLSEDPVALDDAADGLAALCESSPFSYYGQQAAQRLAMLDPDRELVAPTIDGSGPWKVRAAFLDDPSAGAGVQLARLGLYREALAEFDHAGLDAMTPAEIGVVIEQRWAAGDWLMAHDALRTWLRTHPPEQLGESRDKLLLLAYPNKYWELTEKAAAGYGYDPRAFHALVREESNFNKDITSHAGATGLSQLMTPTARSVARWLGLSVTVGQLSDPWTNLRIGTRYFESLSQRYRGNPHMAMAGYNAGEGNVKKWLERFGNLPTDAWVESIPFRETRHYVKRVSRTWQVYRILYDGQGTFPDLSAYTLVAVPDESPE